MLSAAGGTYLSSDSLVFTTNGERATALSILAQWMGFNASGAVFGQGVRCTSSTFKRLFNRTAVGGSITVPDFGAGDPTISAMSELDLCRMQVGVSQHSAPIAPIRWRPLRQPGRVMRSGRTRRSNSAPAR